MEMMMKVCEHVGDEIIVFVQISQSLDCKDPMFSQDVATSITSIFMTMLGDESDEEYDESGGDEEDV